MNPILITGIQRSGSTIIAEILSACGVYSGKVTDMRENIRIKNLMDQYYKEMGLSILGQYPLPDVENLYIPNNWRDNILQFMPNQVWLYKSFRIAQIWPVWNYAFPNAKWIIVRRRTGDIIHSCTNTMYMDAFNDPQVRKEIKVNSVKEGWLWWIHKHEELFLQIIKEKIQYREIWPERLVHGDHEQLFELTDWLGLKWNNEVFNIIEKKLWKAKNIGGQ